MVNTSRSGRWTPSALRPRHISNAPFCGRLNVGQQVDWIGWSLQSRGDRSIFMNWFLPGSIMTCGGGRSDLNRSLKPTHSRAHYDWTLPVKTQPRSLSAALHTSITAGASSFTSKRPVIWGKLSISTLRKTAEMLLFSPSWTCGQTD